MLFGDLTAARYSPASGSNSVRGVWGGGNTVPAQVNIIDYFEIATGGLAVDFGNLTAVRNNLGGASGGHGGLNGGK